MKSPITTLHAALAILGVIAVGVALHLLGVSDATTAVVIGLVGTVLNSMGLMHAADQQTVNTAIADGNQVADTIKKDVQAVIAAAQADVPSVPVVPAVPVVTTPAVSTPVKL